MPNIVFAPSRRATVDSSVNKLVYSFLEKLAKDDANKSLHIEPIRNCSDDRVRTGRVNDGYRAILFRIAVDKQVTYIYVGTLMHDDAIAFAQRARLTVNPVNGIAELIESTEPIPQTQVSAPHTTARTQQHPTQVETHVTESSRSSAAPKSAYAPTMATSLFLHRGIDLPTLVQQLGIDPEIAQAVLPAQNEDELMHALEKLEKKRSVPTWQSSALIDLSVGQSLAETRFIYQITDNPPPVATAPESAAIHPEVPDSTLLAALDHPAARMSFSPIQGNAELREVIENPDFTAWRIFLHPEQRKYAIKNVGGAFRLSGGAGTGKTVVLLHRAKFLAMRSPQARILLTTFSTTLAEALKRDLLRLAPDITLAKNLGDPGVFICGIDAGVLRVMKSTADLTGPTQKVLGSRSAEISGRTPGNRWAEAAISADSSGPTELLRAGTDAPSGQQLSPELRSETFLTAEYALIVLPNAITKEAEYLQVRRPGRGISLDRRKRLAVWSIIKAYRSLASAEGSIDFPEAAAIAAAALTATEGADTPAAVGSPAAAVDHILVDEGQDLSPTHWQFLRALVLPGPNDIFIAEDSHQRIYSHRVVLGRYGIGIVGRSRRLTLNYRTTAQNLRYALGVLAGGAYLNIEEEDEQKVGYRSARQGPQPGILTFPTLTQELDFTAERVRGWLADQVPAETIGLLARDKKSAGQLQRGLEERGLPVRVVEREFPGTGKPLILTMHRAKGMEFSRVLIHGLNSRSMPAQYLLKSLTEVDAADVLLRERSLLYVAATRARDELVITLSGEASDLLPTAP